MFRSVIHLEPISVCGVRQGSPLMLLHPDVLLPCRSAEEAGPPAVRTVAPCWKPSEDTDTD